VVPLLFFTAVPLPEAVLPLRPVAEPLAVDVPVLVLLLTVPVAEPPWEPEAEALPFTPVRVLLAVAVPVALLPRAPVAVPFAVAVLPLVVTPPVAVPPCGPVTVCCAEAREKLSVSAREERARRVILIGKLLGVSR
jgi:hypothetical protein